MVAKRLQISLQNGPFAPCSAACQRVYRARAGLAAARSPNAALSPISPIAIGDPCAIIKTLYRKDPRNGGARQPRRSSSPLPMHGEETFGSGPDNAAHAAS